jgi:hypothetical protein
LEQACHHFDGRGLARAVGAEESEDLALRYIQVYAVHGSELAVGFGEVDEFDHSAVSCGTKCKVQSANLKLQN